MAKFDFKNVQIITTCGTIKGVDLGLTVPDTIKDELKKFSIVEPFEFSGTFEIDDYKPVYDPKEWAKSNGLEVTDDGIYCYKAVYQLAIGNITRYFAPRNIVRLANSREYLFPRGSNYTSRFIKQLADGTGLYYTAGDPFEYTLNEEVKCGYFETDPEMECAPGLYGSTKEFAESFIHPWVDKVAILKLFVPFKDNEILVPYCGYSVLKLPSDKFRFKKCIPVSAEYKKPLLTPSKSELDNNWDFACSYSIMKALDDPKLILQIFSLADHKKFVGSVINVMLEGIEKQEE